MQTYVNPLKQNNDYTLSGEHRDQNCGGSRLVAGLESAVAARVSKLLQASSSFFKVLEAAARPELVVTETRR